MIDSLKLLRDFSFFLNFPGTISQTFDSNYERLSLPWYSLLMWGVLKSFTWQRLWFSILHTKRLLTFPGTCHLNLKQLNCNNLNIFVMNRDWSLSFQEFLKRWGFITINQSKACFMQMSFFAIAASIVEHPYHWQ